MDWTPCADDCADGGLFCEGNEPDSAVVLAVEASLDVVSQEVVVIEACSADGLMLIEASMRSMPVVLVGLWLERPASIFRVLVGACVGPFSERGLEEALGFSVGARCVGACAPVLELDFLLWIPPFAQCRHPDLRFHPPAPRLHAKYAANSAYLPWRKVKTDPFLRERLIQN